MDATTPAGGDQHEGDSDDIESKIEDLAPDDEASNRLRRRLLLRRFWRSSRSFWGSRGDRLAWLLTGTIMFTSVYANLSFGKDTSRLEREDHL